MAKISPKCEFSVRTSHSLSADPKELFHYLSDGDDSDLTAGSSDKSFYVIRVACENHRFQAKGHCHHNGVNDIRCSALA
jgi:hypothetical protein